MIKTWLYKLLSYRESNYKLKSEALIQYQFVQWLRILTLENKINFIWFAISNEIGGGNKNPRYGAYLEQLGKITGAPDMAFIWKQGGGFIEFKSLKGIQAEKQKYFQEWCKLNNVSYKIARSKDEAINIIREWGLIK